MERWVLNHAKVFDYDGDVSILLGPGSASPGYMLKHPSLNELQALFAVHKE